MDLLLKVATNWILPVFFFLAIFGFCASVIVEILDSFARWKARILSGTIEQILGRSMADDFWRNILANPLGERRTPSYLPAHIFPDVIMHWLVMKDGSPLRYPAQSKGFAHELRNTIEPLQRASAPLFTILSFLIEQAEIENIAPADYYSFLQKGLQQWYYSVLDRMASQYKRLAQRALVAVGIVIAVAANFDVIKMVSQLWKTSLLKELVELAEKTSQPLPNLDETLFTTLPLGWSASDMVMFSSVPAFLVKIVGLAIGGFLIFISAQYIYEYVKRRQYAQAAAATK